MSANTFDEVDFRHTLEVSRVGTCLFRYIILTCRQNVLDNIPNMKRLKLNLPFQVVGQKSRTATLLLATTLAAINKRPEEHKSLETFVIDHISDTTVIDICNNPIDLINTMKILGVLEHLIMSIKRQEALLPRQALFSHNLWFLIRKAAKLKSLCLVGWNTKRDINTRRHSHGVSLNVWTMRSLPFSSETSFKLEHLRFLELKRVDIDPQGFLDLVREAADSLKEIYLNEVYLKVHGAEDRENTSLWIGHPDIPRPTKCCWLAADLRNIENLHLDILRATALGYDDFKPDAESSHPDYDLKDPSGYDKSFDQRFVEAVFSGVEKSWENPFEELSVLPNTMNLPHQEARIPPAPSLEFISGPMDIASLSPDAQNRTLVNAQTATQMGNYDAELYQQRRNTTSRFKTCIDGYFVNHNEQTLKVLQNIITIADKGMTLISAEIDRARHGQEALATAVNEVGGQNNDLTGPDQGAAA